MKLATMEMKIPQQALVVALAWGIVMDSVTDNEKKQNLFAPKNFIKFAENYALLYWVFL